MTDRQEVEKLIKSLPDVYAECELKHCIHENDKYPCSKCKQERGVK